MNTRGLPFNKPEDYQYFGALLNEVDDDQHLSVDDKNMLIILKLLLYVKNCTPLERETALSQLTDNALELGAGPLFNCILPLLMLPTLEYQERLVLVKAIDRLLPNLDESVSPFAHKILVLIEPMLIDEDDNYRGLGRLVIYNLSKMAGLNTMIAALRPDIDNRDENVRNTTAIAFSVVASALGVSPLLPLLKMACQSKRSWEVRHTGIKVVQHIAMLIENGQILSSLTDVTDLVAIIKPRQTDENDKVRSIALSLSALTEAAAASNST